MNIIIYAKEYNLHYSMFLFKLIFKVTDEEGYRIFTLQYVSI